MTVSNPNGAACIVVCDDQGVCDTTIVLTTVQFPTTETVDVEIELDAEDTYCLDTDELGGSAFTLVNDCADGNTGNVEFTLDATELCVTYSGESPGTETACLVLCDDLGVCDTTYLNVTTLPAAGGGSGGEQSVFVLTPDDTMTVRNRPIFIPVFANDSLPGEALDYGIVAQPANGDARFVEAGLIEYTPLLDYCGGADELTYFVSTGEQTENATVTVRVVCDQIIIYSGFSPNGDGVNDYLTILGLDQVEDYELMVFNRWGNQVFGSTDYRNDWDGTWNGEVLPDGTYFFILETNDERTTSGYIQIQR